MYSFWGHPTAFPKIRVHPRFWRGALEGCPVSVQLLYRVSLAVKPRDSGPTAWAGPHVVPRVRMWGGGAGYLMAGAEPHGVLLSSCLQCPMVAVLWLYQWPQHSTGHRKGKYDMLAGVCYCVYSSHGKKRASSRGSSSQPELQNPNNWVLTRNSYNVLFFHLRVCIHCLCNEWTHSSVFIWDPYIGIHPNLQKVRKRKVFLLSKSLLPSLRDRFVPVLIPRPWRQ